MRQETESPYDLFISYSHSDDIPFTGKLYRDLKEHGYKVWFDKNSMESNGLSFLQNIRDSLKSHIRLLLVVGPNASTSDYVRSEWEFALVNCIVIIPLVRLGYGKNDDGVSGASANDFDFIPQPILKRKLHYIDFRERRPFKEAFEELLRNLSVPVLPLAKLNSVPNSPANFIARDSEVEQLKEIIMAVSYQPGVITSTGKSTGVQGMGGIGKSVLASAICHDCEIMRSFSDGIYWITIGQQQPEQNVTNAIRLLTGDENINLKDKYEEARNKLRERLQNKNCLVVLDDVWDQQDITVFPSDQALRYRLLITTRNKQTIQGITAKIVEVGLLNKADALALLVKSANGNNEPKRYSIGSLPPEADLIIQECGHLPLAIDMAGGMISSGDTQRWKDVLEALKEADLEYITQQFPDYPYPNLFKVLEASVEFLDEDAKHKYLQLGIFPRDISVPGEIMHLLWEERGTPQRNTNKLLDYLVARSLIQRPRENTYALHDLQVDYLKTKCKNIRELNQLFIDRLGDPFHLPNKYAWKNYIWHVTEAGETATAIKLLQSFE